MFNRFRQLDNSIVLFLAFAMLVIVLRLTMAIGLGLTDDEAYYWAWAQHPQLSYFEHPALTAWLIWLSQSLFGGAEWAIRLPALIFSLGTGWLLFQAVRVNLKTPTAEALAFILFVLLPVFAIGGQLIVPDSPMLFFWVASFWSITKLLEQPRSLKYFILLVMALGFALLSKLTSVLLVLSVLIYFARTASLRHWFQPKTFFPGLILLLIVISPIVLWNIQNDWPMLRFHLQERQGGGFKVSRWVQFLASQAIYYTPFLFPLLTHFFTRRFRSNGVSQHQELAFWLGLPLLLLFSIQPLFSGFKPHWTAPAFLLAIPFVANDLSDMLVKNGRRKNYVYFSLGFLIGANLLLFASFFYPVLPKFHRLVSSSPWESRFDVSNDFYGWPQLAQKVAQLTDREKWFLATHRYQLAGAMWYYSGRPVYSFGKHSNQFSLFQTEADVKNLIGQNAIVFSDNRYKRMPEETMDFDRCDALEPLNILRNAEPSRTFFLWKCYGFKGARRDI